jgi:hypothetical protein
MSAFAEQTGRWQVTDDALDELARKINGRINLARDACSFPCATCGKPALASWFDGPLTFTRSDGCHHDVSAAFNALAIDDEDNDFDPTAVDAASASHSHNGANPSSKTDRTLAQSNGHRPVAGPNGVPVPGAAVQHGRKPTRLSYAVAYARRGMGVFPLHNIERDRECSCGKLQCASAGKHPRLNDWQTLATRDEGQIAAWWKQWPDANVGVKCGRDSDVTVLDVDGDAGRETLRDLEMGHGELPETPIAITGSGGAHFYFKFEEGVGNAVRFAPGLDVRTEGGLVVGVGSVTKRPYVWEEAFRLGELAPARMPAWLSERIKASGKSPTVSGGKVMVPAVETMIEGSGRHNRMWQLGRSLRAQKFPDEAIVAALRETNNKFATPMAGTELEPLIHDILTQPDRRAFQAPVPHGNGAAPALSQEQGEPLRTLTLGALYDMSEEWKTRPWVWEGILPHNSLSMLVGKSESGKSTFIYALIYSIVTGQKFLGRQCEQGRVLYIAGDPASEFVAAETFARLGLGRDAGVLVIAGSLIGNPQAIPDLRRIVQEFKPLLVIGDTLAATIRLDEGKYGESYGAQQPLVSIARDYGPNFLVSHHSQKSAVEAYNVVDLALGSVGVAAVASTRMATRKYRRGATEIYTFEMSHLRIGDPIRGEWVVEKRDNGLVELTGLWSERETTIVRDKILAVLGEATEPMTPTGLREEMNMGMDRRTKMWVQNALRELVKEKVIERIKGTGHGNRWRYQMAGRENPKKGLFDRSTGGD